MTSKPIIGDSCLMYRKMRPKRKQKAARNNRYKAAMARKVKQ